MADEFDPTPYVRPPILDTASGVALGISLLSAMPKPALDNVKKAAKKIHKDTTALQVAWAKSDATVAAPDKRKADMRIDNAWGIFLDRLEAYASLPVADFPKAARARALVDIISPKDREWLKLPYGAEWAESEKRITRIDDLKLEGELAFFAGPEFLLEVRHAHEAYGVALGVTKAIVEAPEVHLADPLRSLARSIGRYGVAVAGMVVDDDAETLAVVRKALRPIDDFRDAQARRNSSGAEAPPPDVTPTTPVPEVK